MAKLPNNNTLVLYRYCSEKEYSSFLNGETLHNISPYNNGGDSITNPRFYFFPAQDMSIRDIQQNLLQPRGIVTPEILMIVWTNLYPRRQTRKYTTRNPKLLAEYQKLLEQSTFIPIPPRYIEYRTEYTLETYNNQNLHLHRAYKISLPLLSVRYTDDITSYFSQIYPDETP